MQNLTYKSTLKALKRPQKALKSDLLSSAGWADLLFCFCLRVIRNFAIYWHLLTTVWNVWLSRSNALLGLSMTMIFFSKSLILSWFKSSHWKFFIAFITSLAHWVQTVLLENIKRRKIRHSKDTLIFDIVMHISIFWINTFFNWKICTWNHKVVGRSENPQG